jgi:hypothetical protein
MYCVEIFHKDGHLDRYIGRKGSGWAPNDSMCQWIIEAGSVHSIEQFRRMGELLWETANPKWLQREDLSGIKVYFEKASDAVAFKLRWGGQ